MWLSLNNAFFSIVVADKRAPDHSLVVRARRKGDIERVFAVAGEFSPGRDYAFRCVLDRDTVARVVAACVLRIDYGNFKGSVRDDALHRAYNRVWSVMGDLQVGGPYSRSPSSNQRQGSVFDYSAPVAGSVGYGKAKADDWANADGGLTEPQRALLARVQKSKAAVLLNGADIRVARALIGRGMLEQVAPRFPLNPDVFLVKMASDLAD